MNERFRLNSELIRDWKDQRALKHRGISQALGCSERQVGEMLAGKVPRDASKLKKLADLMGVTVDDLLISRDGEKAS